MVYYNEHDPFAAAWLRELIAAGHIAFGVVDERSIEDVLPSELQQFKQCHFFAGIGVWSYALRRAGWPDDRPVWTGSCPCQPFSAAGKGDGFADERHLWPAFNHLIGERRPDVIFGEQVASKDADTWIDLVHTDMEALGYAFGAVPFPAAGIGAPHIRDRLYWVADASIRGHSEYQRDPRTVGGSGSGDEGKEPEARGFAQAARDSSEACGMAEPDSTGLQQGQRHDQAAGHGNTASAACVDDRHGAAGPTNGHWGSADWLLCRDGKWRPVEPGTFPLAHGAAARVGRLRGYGNAINAEAAQGFIEAYMSATI